MKKKLVWIFVLLFFLTACGNSSNSGEDIQADQTPKGVVSHQGEPFAGGTFKVGLSSETPFKGQFSYLFNEDPLDWKIMKNTMYGTLERGADLELVSSEVLTFEPAPEENKITMKIVSEDFRWSDGSPVTSQDFKYAYEIVGHPEYQGLLYNEDFEKIQGMEDYHTGEATEISGIQTPDDKTIVIHYTEMSSDVLWGNGLLSEPVPYEQMKDISIDQLQNSEAVLVRPLSVGPFAIEEVTPGETVRFRANEYYWGGLAGVDEITFQWIKPIETVSSLDGGRFDYIEGIDPSFYEEVKSLDNVSILLKEELSYTYLGFNLGRREELGEEEINIYNSDGKMANTNLRTAMAYAIDRDKVTQEYFKHLRYPGDSLILPVYKNLSPENPSGFPYSVENAQRLLEDEGYVDLDGDGYREDPGGNPLEINFSLIEDGYRAQDLAAYYISAWKTIGLKVNLVEDKPLELGEFYSRLSENESGIDVFQATWGLTINPNPTNYYSQSSPYNYTRYTNDKLEEILEGISSKDSLDFDTRVKNYHDFHEEMTLEIPVIPLYYRDQFSAVNKRIDYFEDVHPDGESRNWRWNQIIVNNLESAE